MCKFDEAIKESTEEYKLVGSLMVNGILNHIKDNDLTTVNQVNGYLHSLLESIKEG